MWLFTFFWKCWFSQERTSWNAWGQKELPCPLYSPLLLQSQSALLTSGQPPGCPLSSPALLIHSQRHRQARGHKRLSLPCFFPCHSTPTLFPLAIPNPDHSGTALSFHAFMTLHTLFLKTGMLSIPSFSISKTPTVFARQLRCHLLCEVSSPTHQLWVLPVLGTD